MTKTEKEQVVASLHEQLSTATSVVLASTAGIPVNAVNLLRSEMREKGVQFNVVKNTLAKRALVGTGAEALADQFVGPTAIATHPEEPGIAAKILIDFRQKNEKLEIKAGFDGEDVLDAAGVEVMSKLPGRDELRAKIIGLMTQVPTKLVRVFTAAQRDIVGLLNAREKDIG
jgi:large subunit ribosomal protein L10